MKRVDMQHKTTVKKLGGVTGKGFMPGKSGNPAGRPVAFDFIRNLAQQIGAEVDPVIKKTNAEIVLRRLMKDDGAKFIEVAYGKVPQPIEGDFNLNMRFDYGNGNGQD